MSCERIQIMVIFVLLSLVMTAEPEISAEDSLQDAIFAQAEAGK